MLWFLALLARQSCFEQIGSPLIAKWLISGDPTCYQ